MWALGIYPHYFTSPWPLDGPLGRREFQHRLRKVGLIVELWNKALAAITGDRRKKQS